MLMPKINKRLPDKNGEPQYDIQQVYIDCGQEKDLKIAIYVCLLILTLSLVVLCIIL